MERVLHQTCLEPIEPLFNLQKYSDLRKVLRITAYITRFVRNSRHTFEKVSGYVSAKELADAERYWVRFVQKTEFIAKYIQLHKPSNISPDSRFYGLSPVSSSEGLICLGGRLQHSNFLYLERYPWIIPGKCRFIELLIVRKHHNLYHAGVSETLTQLRESLDFAW